ncbi:hypothetical protein JET76_23065 [Pseudomonas putida]|uniref:hypothetical protein n=1 Tax=Pseudomonas putida TaxID=303 RepID=UPI0018E6AE2F|nr:hypothetical protein [Pseudomonas putida]MBI6944210.1 hypothetical protein [Pseudomonas putida]MBI6960311.1 hypothetical protein [Pseudomonas putida]
MSGYKSFAHLLGLGRGKAAKASGDDPITEDYNTPDPADEQYAEDDDDKPQGRRARRAEDDDDDDASAEDDDLEAEDDDAPRGRKAKGKAKGKGKARRAEDNDDDASAEDDDDASAEDDDDGKSAKAIRRGAVKAERERCARIIAHGIKCGNVEQAAALAFDSNMAPSAAAGVLGLAKASAPGNSLASRMDRVQTPNAGMGDADQSGGMSKMAAAIIAAATDAHQ